VNLHGDGGDDHDDGVHGHGHGYGRDLRLLILHH